MPPYRSLPGPKSLPPGPYLWLQIFDNQKELTFGPVGAILDSGADYTCIPRRIAEAVGHDYEIDEAEDFTGRPVMVKLAVILDANIQLLHVSSPSPAKRRVSQLGKMVRTNLRLPIIEGEDALLGRDILNHFVCTLDGPKLLLEIG